MKSVHIIIHENNPAGNAVKEVIMDYFNAFWVGGLICALAQILLERTSIRRCDSRYCKYRVIPIGRGGWF